MLDAVPATGRDFLSSEQASVAATAAIVNEPFARKHFPNASPLGRRVRLVDASSGNPLEAWREVVGIVRDLGVNPGDPQRADAIYVPFGPTTVVRIGVRCRDAATTAGAEVLAATAREAPEAQCNGPRASTSR